ncbi:uncharacterized protein LOC126661711 [Mercurialis annua]|uniref:uncharacterized protein LOC126661711 n=1 Tax=Mercurialis annua TaxID=3986 RepID=UPI00215EC7FB|nr:uncharacterized protein LOC126661711 [Mercurialis annua]
MFKHWGWSLCHSEQVIEVMALREAICLATGMHLTSFIFEGDTKGIIEAMSRGVSTNAACDVVLHDFCLLSQAFSVCSFSLIRRISNWVTDSIVKQSLRDNSFHCNSLAQMQWLESRLL